MDLNLEQRASEQHVKDELATEPKCLLGATAPQISQKLLWKSHR